MYIIRTSDTFKYKFSAMEFKNAKDQEYFESIGKEIDFLIFTFQKFYRN